MIHPLSSVPVEAVRRTAPISSVRALPAPGAAAAPHQATALGWLARADSELVAHSLRTARLSAALSRRLGWSEIAVRQLERAAALHDIGKTLVPAALLAKPGPLSTEELALIRRHTTWGASLLDRLELAPALAREVALHHHERWDGDGYPHGLAGFDIPEAARIVAVADAYDALTADRTYRQPIGPGEALDQLGRDAGEQFDPQAYEELVGLISANRSSRPC
jgi:putative two-component system response regulator